jgi:phosphoglycolate phosphatase
LPKQEMTQERAKEIEQRFLAIYHDEFLVSPQLFEGAWDFLQKWPNKVAIVSNKRMRFITPIVEHLQLNKFEWAAVVGGDSYSKMKPHPEPFLAAMAAAGVTPEETVIVGDGVPDIQGALAVGSLSVAVEFGYHPVADLMDLGAWAQIKSFAELAPLLRSII